ncbi:sulfotransferase family protein [Herbidospora cretacea]|uniref:sulfotransferase family protein n=1 Tax=Herbidospora cretacea TaxID=28444 RepID=UPI0007C87042|nr:sulfotransferase family protein [Herbidospora cretacea]
MRSESDQTRGPLVDVIGAGFGRTGTRSLKAALELLGFGPCYHMATVIAEPRRVRQWLDVGEGRPADWDEIFAGHRSAVDFPAASYWRELAARYPAAKVILTVRDPGRWYDSARETIFRREIEAGVPKPWRQRLKTRLIAWRAPDFALFPRMSKATVSDRLFDGRVADRDHCLAVFRRHVEEVRATIPADRLLVFECREGWEPLCRFLGVPVPDVPFPQDNERAAFHAKKPGRALRLIVRGR